MNARFYLNKLKLKQIIPKAILKSKIMFKIKLKFPAVSSHLYSKIFIHLGIRLFISNIFGSYLGKLIKLSIKQNKCEIINLRRKLNS